MDVNSQNQTTKIFDTVCTALTFLLLLFVLEYIRYMAFDSIMKQHPAIEKMLSCNLPEDSDNPFCFPTFRYR